jgi:hypothetical protein
MNDIAEKIHLIKQLASNPAATASLLDQVNESLVESDYRKLPDLRTKLAEYYPFQG